MYLGIAMYNDNDKVYKFKSIESFVDWILLKDKHGYTFIAHNSQEYDAHFIKKEFVKRCIKSIDIQDGNKIKYMYL